MLAWEYANSAFKAQIHELCGVYHNRPGGYELSLCLPLTVADAIILEQHLGRTQANEFIRAVDPWCYPGEKTKAALVLVSCVQRLLAKSRDALNCLHHFPKEVSLLSSFLRSSSRKGQRSSENPKQSAAILPRKLPLR